MFVESCRALQVAEKVNVTIISAKLLDDADLAGKSDPYVVVEIVGKLVSTPQTKAQTKVIYNNLNPIFNEGLQIKNYYPGEALLFSVMDKDKGGCLSKDDCLGTVALSSSSFYPDGFRGDLVLQPPQHGKRGGVLTVQVTPSASLSHWQHKPRLKPPVTMAASALSPPSVTVTNPSPPAAVTVTKPSPPVVAQSAQSVSAGGLAAPCAASPQPVKPQAPITNLSPSNGHTGSQSTFLVQSPLQNQIPAGGLSPAPAKMLRVQQQTPYQVAAAPTKLSYVTSPAPVPYMFAPAQGLGIAAHSPCPPRVNVVVLPPSSVTCTSAAPPMQCFTSAFSPQYPHYPSQQPGVHPNFVLPTHHTSYLPGVNGYTVTAWQQPSSPGRFSPGAPVVVHYIRRHCSGSVPGYTTPNMSYSGSHGVSARGIQLQQEASPRIAAVVPVAPPSDLPAAVPAIANNEPQLGATEDAASNTLTPPGFCTPPSVPRGAQYTPSSAPQPGVMPAAAHVPQPHSNLCSQR